MAVDEFKIRQDNTQFSISSVLEDSEHKVVDLTNAESVSFRMSPIGGGDTKVDAVADFSGERTGGGVQYNWEVGDTDTAGSFLGSWRVMWNSPDDFQDFPNGGYILVNITPALDTLYATYANPEEVKKMLTLSGTTFADEEIGVALTVASDALDELCGGRKFRLDTSAQAEDTTRYYRPMSPTTVIIDDIVKLTTVMVDNDGDGDFEWEFEEGQHFFLWPYNAVADGRPYTQLQLNTAKATRAFPSWYGRSVEVTGIFGWPAIPSFLRAATSMLAVRLVKRMREAPFGVAVSSGIEVGSAVRIARSDPDIMSLCEPYTREKVV
jgi:hypothetical protein